jgi:hypothetical protein
MTACKGIALEKVFLSNTMSRNLYILAASLLLFSLISCGMSFLPSGAQPGLPGNGSLWKTTALFLFVGSLIAAFAGIMTAMFEQVERRNETRSRRSR